MKLLTFTGPGLVVLAAAFFWLRPEVAYERTALSLHASENTAGQASVGTPTHVTVDALQQPPKVTVHVDEQETPPLGVQARYVAGPGGIPQTEVENGLTAPNAQPNQGSSSKPPLTIQVNSLLAPSGSLSTTPVAEPAVAQSGEYVFYTANDFAARSTVGGGSWSYINPYSGMSDFCCDQDAIADPGRGIIMWYRQGLYQSSTGQGRFILGVSNDGGSSFCDYTYRPIDVNSAFTNSHWDLPQLALSDNFLYISIDILNGTGGFERKLIMRWPLNSLKSCSSFNFQYLNGVTSYWAAPVQGATTTMYIGDHRGTDDSFTVYVWPENSNSYTSSVTHTIPTWTFQKLNSSCKTPDNLNPCSRSLSTIQAAWVRKASYQSVGELGFMWDAHEGGGFPFPYIEAVTLREDTLAVSGRPLMWSSGTAYQYPFASPNGQGDLGVTLTMMGGSSYPSTIFLIDDSYDAAPPPWESLLLKAGNAGATGWGDFVRNRSYSSNQAEWASAGHTQQGGSGGADTQPRYYVVGRSE